MSSVNASPRRSGVGRRSPERSFGGLVSGGGDRVEGFLEHGAGEGVEGESAVGLAVSVVPHHQPGGGCGVAFFLLQQLGFVGVGGVGGDEVEDPAAEDLEGFGVELGGLVEQVRFGLLDELPGRGRSGSSASACRITWACSTWTAPRPARCESGRAARGRRRAAPPGGRRARVVRVVTACQFAVEDLAVSPGRSIRVACDRSRAFSSASCASAAWTSPIASVVSAASMDHTGTSVTEVS